ncbi:MAG: YifB family Mg chelatase-like AAA ATPase [Spirochaetia bacterium]|nr:YifB family Mg chelatase-like AAA ATPase [Spirochaetia bacterium]
MLIYSYANRGFEGELIEIEADLRRGMPGFDIVGLPDSAVRESRERVRAALRNSGFSFPREHVLINLAPAGVRKEGASLDLAIALAILMKSVKINFSTVEKVMVLGELELSGRLRTVKGVSGAIAAGITQGIDCFIIPLSDAAYGADSCKDFMYIGDHKVFAVPDVKTAVQTLFTIIEGKQVLDKSVQKIQPGIGTVSVHKNSFYPDFSDIQGMMTVKRAMIIAAAGKHHVLIFGPPGGGKSMTAARFPGLLPKLSDEQTLQVSRIHSLSEKSVWPGPSENYDIPPVIMPHHSVKKDQLIGGGAKMQPGDVSLAHHGLLILDEAAEFNPTIMRSMRTAIENRKVEFLHQGKRVWFPASFQLMLLMNACPCGRLGQEQTRCMCKPLEIHKFWKRIGTPLLDRISIRVPAVPENLSKKPSAEELTSEEMQKKVERARQLQIERFSGELYSVNSEIPAERISIFCNLTNNLLLLLSEIVNKSYFSARAVHSILRIARTSADLDESQNICEKHLLEAIDLRKYGDGDFFWKCLY